MQKYHYIWKCLCDYFCEWRRGRFVIRVSLGSVIALLFLVVTASLGARSAQTQVLNTCSAHEQSYGIVAGDTLGGIASRYGTTWSSLASYNDIANPDLIFVGQVVCVPAGGSTESVAPVVQPQVVSAAPVASAPVATSAPAATGGSVASIINQVFGPYAGTANQVAMCESGLNPGATNPYSSAAGLFQIMPSTWSGTSQAGSSPYNAWANTVAAHEIFVRDGYSWSEWTCK